jgi:hemolysin III
MAALTGSFRLADVASSALAPRKSAASRTPESPAQSVAALVRAAASAAPPMESNLWSQLVAATAQMAQALQRPAGQARSAAETVAEERLNTWTHGLGLALSVIGVAYLATWSLMMGGAARMAACGLYGATLLLMYAASTLYHKAQCPRLKLRLQLCDHAAIYLFIAGTYTPFLVILMRNPMGYALLAAVWSLAAVGVYNKVRHANCLEQTSPLPCLCLGWLVIVAIKPLLVVLPLGGLLLLFAGGVSYSAGVAFFCRDDKPSFHAIWHLFVMGGSALHFGAIAIYVAA